MWNQTLRYFPNTTLNNVNPTILSQTQSELAITLYGERIVDTGENLICRLTSNDTRLQHIHVPAAAVVYYDRNLV